MATKDISFADLVKTLDKEIQVALKTEYRNSDLDKRPHVVDVSYQTLLVNNGNKDTEFFQELYATFIQEIKNNISSKNIFNSVQSDSARIGAHFKSNKPGAVFIENPPLLMAVSYNSISTLIKKVVRTPNLRDTAFGVQKTQTAKKDSKNRIIPYEFDETEVSKLNIGHVPSALEMGGSEYFVSPLSTKVGAVQDVLETLNISGTGYTDAINLAEQTLKDIFSIQADFKYTFRSSTSNVFNGIEKIFGNMFVAVTIQTSDLNQKEFGTKELELFNDFEKKLVALLADKTLYKKLLNVKGSNTIFEDMKEGLINIIRTGKANLKSHNPQKITGNKQIVGNDKKLPNSERISEFIQRPLDITAKAQQNSVDLVSLQSLLNLHLQDVISANMGSGTSRDILNYRTGRFASSVHVERMSMSRQGMITAFYSYMKNPYATFSEGGKQSKPTTRDPKLLISKSIREIATEKVANRLRAVVI